MTISLTRPLVLASNSPRRRQLLRESGFEFTTEVRPTPEEFPPTLPADEVPAFLARQKAECFGHDHDNRLILCADTIVVQGTLILNKPADEAEARTMLKRLPGLRTGLLPEFACSTATATPRPPTWHS